MSLLSIAFPSKTPSSHESVSTQLNRKHESDSSKQGSFSSGNQLTQSFKCADFITPTTATNKSVYKEKYVLGARHADETFQIVDHNTTSVKYKGTTKSHFNQNRQPRTNFTPQRNVRRPMQRLL